MPLISEMLQITMYSIWCAADMRLTRGSEVLWSDAAPQACTFLSLGFIYYSLSSLVFFSAAFNHYLLLLSTCHLDDIVLYLWEWLMYNPQGVNGSQLHLLLTDIFTFKVLPSCFVWTHSNTQGWNMAQVKQTCTPLRTCTMWWFFIITEMPEMFEQQKSLCRAKEQKVCTRMLFKCSIHWPFSKVQITALWWQLQDLMNNLWGDISFMIYAEISLCMPSSTACHFLTHAIKGYVCGQITDLNPWPSLHLKSHALRSQPITLNK